MSEDEEVISKRKYTRYTPEKLTTALIDIDPENDFNPTISAVVLTEAYKGCGVTTHNIKELQLQDYCIIQVGKLAPLPAKVVWRENFDQEVSKIGFEYLE